MQKITLVFLLVVLGFCEEGKAPNRFPHKLWLYWNDKDLSRAPVFTQLCVNNIRHFAAVSGWEATIVDNDSVFQHLTEESGKRLRLAKERISVLLENRPSPQDLADLHRLFLLHDNGGMWVDISSVFFRDLSWVESLEQLGLVDNSLARQPEVLLFSTDIFYGGNKTVVFDEKQQRDAYLFPGYENWFLLAKPQTEFFKDVIGEILYAISRDSLKDYQMKKAE